MRDEELAVLPEHVVDGLGDDERPQRREMDRPDWGCAYLHAVGATDRIVKVLSFGG